MKKLILIFTSFIILSQTLNSQINSTKNFDERSDYWNMAFTGGGLLSLIDRIEKDNSILAGYNAGFEMFYDMNKEKSAVVINVNYGRIKKRVLNTESVNNNTYTEYFELTFGPRFYLGKRYFFETVLGNYVVNQVTNRPQPVGLEYNPEILLENATFCFGVGIGSGSRFKLSDNFDVIIKGKMNFLLPQLNAILYAGLNTGIVFNNKKIETEIETKYSKNRTWSVTVSGGINNPELFHSDEYRLAGNIGIEGAYRSAPKFEVYGSINYNKIDKRTSLNYDGSITDLTFGPRFMFGEEKYLSFIELGMGLYMQDYQYDYYSDNSGPFMGINFGTGLIIGINEHIGFPIKGKIHLLFNERNHPGGFLTATGGLRYTL